MSKKRVWCLYRVSSKMQVSADDDIPVQRKSCLDFVATKSDWEVTNELYEKGVSGWKKKAADRDEMNIIKDGASNNEFDVLLVFMNDRIGRREDETPFVVQFLIEQGVEVWSVKEGQTRIEQHVDKLLNFITFWQSSGESKKTSVRVREAKKQMAQQGFFHGGRVPLGYKIIETDTPHWKKKDKMQTEMAIDEERVEIVKLIFSMYVEKHMGFRKIMDYLNDNGYRNNTGKTFSLISIKRIIINPTYTGRVKYTAYDGKEGDTMPYNEKLRIISDDVFNKAQQILNAKKKQMKNSRQDKTEIPLVGKLMFSGLAFCGYCEQRLVASYNYKNSTSNGKTYRHPVYHYRCPTKKSWREHNHESVGWGGLKFDKIAIQLIKNAFSQVDVKMYIETSVNRKKKEILLKEENVKILKKEKSDYEKQLDKLNNEIVKSLMGDSNFTSEQLSGAINGVQKKLDQVNEKLDEITKEIENQRENYSDVMFVAKELEDWEVKFDNADDHLKKAMLSRIIDKVYFTKGQVRIKFEMGIEEYLAKMLELS